MSESNHEFQSVRVKKKGQFETARIGKLEDQKMGELKKINAKMKNLKNVSKGELEKAKCKNRKLQK